MNKTKAMRNIRLLLLITLIFFGAEASWASELSDVAKSMPAGTWAELRTKGLSHSYFQYPGGNGNTSTQFMGTGTWDPNTRQVLFIGAGHYNTSQLHFYSESSNTWTKKISSPGGPAPTYGHAYYHNAIAPGARMLGFISPSPSTTKLHLYHIDQKRWTQKTSDKNDGAIAHALEYFPERGKWYVADGTRGRIREYNPDTDTWRIHATKTECFGAPGKVQVGYYNQFSAYNPVRHEIVFGGGSTQTSSGFVNSKSWCKMDKNGTIKVLPMAPVPMHVSSASIGAIVTIDPASGDFLLLTQTGKFYAFDFTTNKWSNISDQQTRPAVMKQTRNNVIDGFAVPISTYGVVMYFDAAGDKSTIWLYKHAQGGEPVTPAPPPSGNPTNNGGPSVDATPPSAPSKLTLVQTQNPPPPNPPTLQLGDFATLCARSSTIFCQDFNSPLPVDDDRLTEVITSNNGKCEKLKSKPNKGCPEVVDGTLKFTIPSNSGSGGAGAYNVRFADFLNGQSIGPGQEVFIQWKQRFSASFLNTRYKPTSAGWKQGMIGAADEYSCSSNEIVVQNDNQRGWPILYHACGYSEGFTKKLPGYDFDLQPGGPGGVCSYVDITQKGKMSPGCTPYFPDEWMTFQLGLKHGQPGEKSRMRLWVAREGKPSILAIDYQRVLRNNKGYGKLWLLPYQTHKDSAQTHPAAYVWYDQVIISRTQLPDR